MESMEVVFLELVPLDFANEPTTFFPLSPSMCLSIFAPSVASELFSSLSTPDFECLLRAFIKDSAPLLFDALFDIDSTSAGMPVLSTLSTCVEVAPVCLLIFDIVVFDRISFSFIVILLIIYISIILPL